MKLGYSSPEVGRVFDQMIAGLQLSINKNKVWGSMVSGLYFDPKACRKVRIKDRVGIAPGIAHRHATRRGTTT